MNIPSNLKYSNDHEWCRVEGEFAYVGITDFAQSQLGDIVFVDVPTVGETLLPYLSMSMGLFNLVYLISNVALLLRCAKNICAEGDEEVAPKPSRFEWINRIGNSYNQTMEKLKENSRADGDAFWHNHMKNSGNSSSTNTASGTKKKHKKKKKK